MTIFSSCDPDPVVPEQNKIYQCYSAEYNASLDKSTVRADFYLNAASSQIQQRLELTHPSNVKFAGDELLFNTIERSYRKEFIGLKEGSFVYTNYDGNEFINNMEMVAPIQLALSSDSTDQQFDYYLEVIGGVLAPNETIELRAVSLASNYELYATYESINGLIIQITTNQLSALGAGDVVITASRSASLLELGQSNPVGGEIRINYSVQDTLTIY